MHIWSQVDVVVVVEIVVQSESANARKEIKLLIVMLVLKN